MAKYTGPVEGVSPLRRLFMSQRALEEARRRELSLRIQREAFEQYRELLGRGLETYSDYGTGWALSDRRVIFYGDVDKDAGLVQRVRVLPNTSLKEQLREQKGFVTEEKYYLDRLALTVTQTCDVPINDWLKRAVTVTGDYQLGDLQSGAVDCRRVEVKSTFNRGGYPPTLLNSTGFMVIGETYHRALSFVDSGYLRVPHGHVTYTRFITANDTLELLIKVGGFGRDIVGDLHTELPLARNLFTDVRDLYRQVEDSRAA